MAKRKAKPTSLQECTQAMAALRRAHKGNNRFGEYGANVRAAYARWAVTYTKLTGNPAPSIYGN